MERVSLSGPRGRKVDACGRDRARHTLPLIIGPSAWKPGGWKRAAGLEPKCARPAPRPRVIDRKSQHAPLRCRGRHDVDLDRRAGCVWSILAGPFSSVGGREATWRPAAGRSTGVPRLNDRFAAAAGSGSTHRSPAAREAYHAAQREEVRAYLASLTASASHIPSATEDPSGKVDSTSSGDAASARTSSTGCDAAAAFSRHTHILAVLSCGRP